MEGKNDREIMVLTAYNVPQEIKAGGDTLHAQQTSLYMLDGIDQPNPREQFIENLVKVIKKAVSKDKDTIITGDFNEVVGENPWMMAKVLLAGNLVDVYEVKHGNECNIATYIRGKRRLDYCFVTPRLVAHVVRCGFEPFNVCYISDHRGSFVDFCTVDFSIEEFRQ